MPDEMDIIACATCHRVLYRKDSDPVNGNCEECNGKPHKPTTAEMEDLLRPKD